MGALRGKSSLGDPQPPNPTLFGHAYLLISRLPLRITTSQSASPEGRTNRKEETMNNLKHIGLIFVTIVAMNGFASAAEAGVEFHSDAEATSLTVEKSETQKYLYETGKITVECATVGGAGNMQKTTQKELHFTPQYSQCTTTIPFTLAEVSMNKCFYTLTLTETEAAGQADLNCTESNQITITVKTFGVSICTLHIGKQAPAGHVDYSNNGTNSINVQPTVTGMVATRQGSSECGSLQSKTGTYTGPLQIIGEKAFSQNKVNVQVK
jgi:hypothetical protein